jgi:ion channel POLLUX/CASTOR
MRNSQKVTNKVSWKKRLQYEFDNFMSKGGISVFLALSSAFFAAFALMTFARYLSEWLFPNENLESTDFPWAVFVQLIGLRDAGENDNFAAKFVGIVTIFVGLVLFSSLVAFITQEFEAKLQDLRKGKSLVVEENHTLILGFKNRVIDIIKELVIANESESYASIVILSAENKEDMDDFLRTNITELKTTKLITRNGSITNVNDLKKVGINSAKSVIILNHAETLDSEESKHLSDARAVKSILAVLAATEEEELPPIVIEIHSEQYRRLAENLAPGIISTLEESDILARILVQTSRSIGLAIVYLSLVGFEGDEFYFYSREEGWNGLTFGQLPFHFLNCIPIGLRYENGVVALNPDRDYRLATNDDVIVIAEDDSTIEFHLDVLVRVDGTRYAEHQEYLEKKIENYLIIGWNSKTPIALKEYASYLIEGSRVNLAVDNLTPEIEAEFNKISKAYPDIKMDAFEVDLNSVRELNNLKPYQFDSISILAGQGQDAEQVDAKTLTILLELREIFQTYTADTGKEVTTDLIAEIVDSEETDLVIKAGVKDFLITNQFVSKILAQASQSPQILPIYRDLFSAEGSELYLKPVWLYFPPQYIGKLTFADCVLAAQNRGEVCIGVKIGEFAQEKEKNFGIDLIPNLDKRLHLTPNDFLITFAQDET